MAGVKTLTVCPFPRTAPVGQNATTVEDCTITFAEALGGGFLAMQIILLLTGTLGLVVFVYRTWRLYTYCHIKRVSMINHYMLPHFMFNISFNTFLILGSVDLFGFRGVVPVDAYVIFDEITAASAISNGVMTANFLYNIANGLQRPRNSNVRYFTSAIVVLVWLNFVGFIILGVTDYEKYRLYEALKSFGGLIILFGFGLVATYFALQIRKVMRDVLDMSERSQTKRQLLILSRKHFRFLVVVSGAGIVLLANGIISISASDWSWTIVFADLPDYTQIAVRAIFIANTFLCIYLFKVPSLGSQDAFSPSPKHAVQGDKQVSPFGPISDHNTPLAQDAAVHIDV